MGDRFKVVVGGGCLKLLIPRSPLSAVERKGQKKADAGRSAQRRAMRMSTAINRPEMGRPGWTSKQALVSVRVMLDDSPLHRSQLLGCVVGE